MKLLILGGTVFLGRHLVEAALKAGHEVTLFNRGQHNPELFPAVERLRGDRGGDLTPLQGRRWDAVIDTCGYVPGLVRKTATLLADKADHYTFVSSISVYPEGSPPGLAEDAPVAQLEGRPIDVLDGDNYGPLKALCEDAAAAAMPDRVLVVRPGLIVGPHDPSDRFTYWPSRLARGGEVLAPGEPGRQIQLIDVRDLAEWTLRMVSARQNGTYNATGPGRPLTMGQMLQACRQETGNKALLTWVPESFLLANSVGPWMELPLWLPDRLNGMLGVNCNKAFGAGLTCRPLAETIRETLAWDQTRPPGTERRAGLSPDKEAAVLRTWHAQT